MGAPQLTFVNNQAPQCGAESLNAFTQEINNLVTSMGLEINETSFEQIANGIIKGIATGNFYEYSGTENAVVLTSLGSKTAALTYYDGMQAAFISTLTNTGAATINIDGIGVKNIKDQDGNDLVSGEISGYMKLVYRTDDDFFTLVSTSGHEQPERTDELIKIITQDSDAVIYPEIIGTFASISGDYTSPTAATHLIFSNGGALELYRIIGGPVTGAITAFNLSGLPPSATIGGINYYMYQVNTSKNKIIASDYSEPTLSYRLWSDGFIEIDGRADNIGHTASGYVNLPFTLTTQFSLRASPAVAPTTANSQSAAGVFMSNSQVALTNCSGQTSTFGIYWQATGWIDLGD